VSDNLSSIDGVDALIAKILSQELAPLVKEGTEAFVVGEEDARVTEVDAARVDGADEGVDDSLEATVGDQAGLLLLLLGCSEMREVSDRAPREEGHRLTSNVARRLLLEHVLLGLLARLALLLLGLGRLLLLPRRGIVIAILLVLFFRLLLVLLVPGLAQSSHLVRVTLQLSLDKAGAASLELVRAGKAKVGELAIGVAFGGSDGIAEDVKVEEDGEGLQRARGSATIREHDSWYSPPA